MNNTYKITTRSDEETIDSFKDDDAILLLDNELIDVESIESLEDILSLPSSFQLATLSLPSLLIFFVSHIRRVFPTIPALLKPIALLLILLSPK